MFTGSFLLASLLWSSIGFGYFIYGKKQGLWVPMVGGIAIIVVSYVGGTALIMSAISLGIMGLVYYLLRQGY
jgi:hypothetical protein